METQRSVTKRWVPRQPHEFASQLVHRDKETRLVALETVQKWLKDCDDQSGSEYARLWHGLFFCMWIDSNSLIQDELAVGAGRLVHLIGEGCQLLWIKTFWSEMQDGWNRLDLHHMVRFLRLLRNVVGEVFKALRVGGWNAMQARSVTSVFTKDVPTGKIGAESPQQSQALFLHFLRIFWSELWAELKVGRATASVSVILELLEPLCILAESCHIEIVLHTLHRRIFRIAPLEFCEALLERLSSVRSRPTSSADSKWLCDITISELQHRLAAEKKCQKAGKESIGDPIEEVPFASRLAPSQRDDVVLAYLQQVDAAVHPQMKIARRKKRMPVAKKDRPSVASTETSAMKMVKRKRGSRNTSIELPLVKTKTKKRIRSSDVDKKVDAILVPTPACVSQSLPIVAEPLCSRGKKKLKKKSVSVADATKQITRKRKLKRRSDSKRDSGKS